MTLINAANLHTAVPGWALDTLSLVAIPEPTLEDLADLDTFDDMLLVDMLLAASPEPMRPGGPRRRTSTRSTTSRSARATRAAPTATGR